MLGKLPPGKQKPPSVRNLAGVFQFNVTLSDAQTLLYDLMQNQTNYRIMQAYGIGDELDLLGLPQEIVDFVPMAEPDTSALGYLDLVNSNFSTRFTMSTFIGGMLGAARSIWSSIFNFGSSFKVLTSDISTNYGYDNNRVFDINSLPLLHNFFTTPMDLTAEEVITLCNDWFFELTDWVFDQAKEGNNDAWALLDKIAFDFARSFLDWRSKLTRSVSGIAAAAEGIVSIMGILSTALTVSVHLGWYAANDEYLSNPPI